MDEHEARNAAHPGSERDPFTVRRYTQFARHAPADVRRVLDAGCSTGRGGAALVAALPGARVIGLEYVGRRLSAIPEGAYERVLRGSVTAVPLDDASVDAVVCGEVIEHLTEVDARLAVVEFGRVLRPGGWLALTTPNPSYLRLKFTGGTVLHGAHLSVWTPAALSALVRDAGFGDVRVCGSGRVSAVLGERFPMPVYGSYLLTAVKGG